jgi:hypothetical protein
MIGAVAELGLVRVLAARAAERFDAGSLCVPPFHLLLARKRNCARAGVSLTALTVAKSTGVFTPLRGSRGLRAAGVRTSCMMPPYVHKRISDKTATTWVAVAFGGPPLAAV